MFPLSTYTHSTQVHHGYAAPSARRDGSRDDSQDAQGLIFWGFYAAEMVIYVTSHGDLSNKPEENHGI